MKILKMLNLLVSLALIPGFEAVIETYSLTGEKEVFITTEIPEFLEILEAQADRLGE